MGHHCCSKQKVKRGLWSPEEDEKLIKYITTHGHGSWSSVPKFAGLQRCGKSCRLRWINYLRPDLKRGSFSAQEERVIIDVHRILGNRWAQIAKHLPGRTDNEVKNFWNSCIKKKLLAQGLDPNTHNLIPSYKTNYDIYNNGCNFSKPTSVFSVNSSQMSTDASVDMNTPFSTLLSIPPTDNNFSKPHFSHDAPTIPIYELQNPNAIWTIQEQNPTSSLLNPSGCCSTRENCLWSGGLQPMELTAQDEIMLQPEKQVVKPQQEKASEVVEFDQKADILMGEQNMDASCFDFDFVESTLMQPCGMFYNASPVDQFAWDC